MTNKVLTVTSGLWEAWKRVVTCLDVAVAFQINILNMVRTIESLRLGWVMWYGIACRSVGLFAWPPIRLSVCLSGRRLKQLIFSCSQLFYVYPKVISTDYDSWRIKVCCSLDGRLKRKLWAYKCMWIHLYIVRVCMYLREDNSD